MVGRYFVWVYAWSLVLSGGDGTYAERHEVFDGFGVPGQSVGFRPGGIVVLMDTAGHPDILR